MIKESHNIVFSDSLSISLQNLLVINQSRKVEELEKYGGVEQLAASLLTDLRNGIPAEEQENEFAARTKMFETKHSVPLPRASFSLSKKL